MKALISAEDERKFFAENFKKLLNTYGINQSDMARKTGIPITTINSWFLGDKYPGLKNQQKIAEFFNITRSDLLSNKEIISNPRTTRIPLLGNIACGKAIFCEESIEQYIYDFSEKINTSNEYFYLRTEGDSMYPTIPDGSLVLIRKQDDVQNGDIAACVIEEDNKITLKRVKKATDSIILLPENTNYEPIVIERGQHIRIIGKAISFKKELEN